MASSQPGLRGLAQVRSIDQVSDITPDMAVYEPLRTMLEEYRMSVVQADGRFNGSASLTQGDFVIYLSDFINVVYNTAFPVTEQYFGHGRAINDLSSFQQELEATEDALRQLMIEVNQALP